MGSTTNLCNFMAIFLDLLLVMVCSLIAGDFGFRDPSYGRIELVQTSSKSLDNSKVPW